MLPCSRYSVQVSTLRLQESNTQRTTCTVMIPCSPKLTLGVLTPSSLHTAKKHAMPTAVICHLTNCLEIEKTSVKGGKAEQVPAKRHGRAVWILNSWGNNRETTSLANR